MKILFYINILSGGGAERVMSSLANEFCKQGHEVILVTSYQTPNEFFVEDGIKRLFLDKKNHKGKLIKNLRWISLLRMIIKKEKPEYAVSFMSEPNFRLLLSTIGLRKKVKTVVSVRNDPAQEYSGFLSKLLIKTIFSHASGYVFQTKEAETFFSKMIKKKTIVISNGVEDSFFKHEWNRSSNCIVTIGRLSKQKNQSLLIKSFCDIAPNYPELTLSIYGDGPLGGQLAEEIESSNCSDRISLKGFSNDVPSVLEGSKLFVLSSDFEGMPNVLMEAQAIGVPCISTDCPCGGPRAIIQNNENGLLVPINNQNALSSAIKLVLDNPSLQERFSNNSKRRAQAFSYSNIYNLWMEYLLAI